MLLYSAPFFVWAQQKMLDRGRKDLILWRGRKTRKASEKRGNEDGVREAKLSRANLTCFNKSIRSSGVKPLGRKGYDQYRAWLAGWLRVQNRLLIPAAGKRKDPPSGV